MQDTAAEPYQLVAGDWNDQALATLTNFGDAPTEAALVTAAQLLAHAPVTGLVRSGGLGYRAAATGGVVRPGLC